MAKRKRLTAFDPIGHDDTDPAPTHYPPVARIAADAATQAALDDLATELREAREGGRMVLELPLDLVEATHLQRDRIMMDPDEMALLKASIRSRDQQMPIEVVALGNGRYGLISGARRLAALSALHAETGEVRFATVKALLRPFKAAPESYLAMVEENEIRADLSFYERGRLAHDAARLGVFETPAAAVKMLFQHALAPKRSKILSFVALHEALGDVLRFPKAIPEKLGLALVKALEADPALNPRLRRALQEGPGTASAECDILERGLRPEPAARALETRRQDSLDGEEGIQIKARPGRVILTGRGVTKDFLRDLGDWLDNRA